MCSDCVFDIMLGLAWVSLGLGLGLGPGMGLGLGLGRGLPGVTIGRVVVGEESKRK